jgi:hypothetical protein
METEVKKPKQAKSNIPRKEADLNDVSGRVLEAWKENPGITLLWTSPAKLEQQLTEFDDAYFQRMKKGGTRPAINGEIKELTASMNKHLAYLKVYFLYKYGKELQTSFYPQLGLVKIGKAYRYPYDRDKRSQSLTLTLEAIEKNGFAAETYGTAFWQAIKTRYDELLLSISETDGTISRHVGRKKLLRREIVLTLNSLIHVLKGNYPKTWKTVIREWGFQKEKY